MMKKVSVLKYSLKLYLTCFISPDNISLAGSQERTSPAHAFVREGGDQCSGLVRPVITTQVFCLCSMCGEKSW